jgi:hypothetical protein
MPSGSNPDPGLRFNLKSLAGVFRLLQKNVYSKLPPKTTIQKLLFSFFKKVKT